MSSHETIARDIEYLMSFLKQNHLNNPNSVPDKDVLKISYKLLNPLPSHTGSDILRHDLVKCTILYSNFLITYCDMKEVYTINWQKMRHMFWCISAKFSSYDMKNSYILLATESVFDLLLQPWAHSWACKELLRTYNMIVHGSSVNIRHQTLANIGSMYLYKFFDLLQICGDYEHQSLILEVLFRMCGPSYFKSETVGQLIPESNKLRNLLMNISFTTFDEDVRMFLDENNLKNPNIFSFVCYWISLDDFIFGHSTEKISAPKLWMDCDLQERTLSWTCSSRVFYPQDTCNSWEVVYVFTANVAKVDCTRCGCNRQDLLVTLTLNKACVTSEKNIHLIVQAARTLKFYTSGSKLINHLMLESFPVLFGKRYLVGAPLQRRKKNVEVQRPLYVSDSISSPYSSASIILSPHNACSKSSNTTKLEKTATCPPVDATAITKRHHLSLHNLNSEQDEDMSSIRTRDQRFILKETNIENIHPEDASDIYCDRSSVAHTVSYEVQINSSRTSSQVLCIPSYKSPPDCKTYANECLAPIRKSLLEPLNDSDCTKADIDYVTQILTTDLPAQFCNKETVRRDDHNVSVSRSDDSHCASNLNIADKDIVNLQIVPNLKDIGGVSEKETPKKHDKSSYLQEHYEVTNVEVLDELVSPSLQKPRRVLKKTKGTKDITSLGKTKKGKKDKRQKNSDRNQQIERTRAHIDKMLEEFNNKYPSASHIKNPPYTFDQALANFEREMEQAKKPQKKSSRNKPTNHTTSSDSEQINTGFKFTWEELMESLNEKPNESSHGAIKSNKKPRQKYKNVNKKEKTIKIPTRPLEKVKTINATQETDKIKQTLPSSTVKDEIVKEILLNTAEKPLAEASEVDLSVFEQKTIIIGSVGNSLERSTGKKTYRKRKLYTHGNMSYFQTPATDTTTSKKCKMHAIPENEALINNEEASRGNDPKIVILSNILLKPPSK